MQLIALPTGRRVRRLRHNAVALGWIVLACVSFPYSSSAQNLDVSVSIRPRAPLDPTVSRSPVIRADVQQVLIPTTVTDPLGRPLQGLQKQDFRLVEDGKELDIASFFVEDQPISIGIVLDLSGSMGNKVEQARQAISQFLRLSPLGDEFFLLTFQDRPELVRGFTTSIDEIEDDLRGIQPKGWTSLYDAIVMGIHQMKKASRERRVLLVLSDGGDNNSRYTKSELKNLVRETDVRIFSISIQSHTPVLDKLADESGGHGYQVPKLEDLPDAASKLSAEVHGGYVLGFHPPERPKDGKYHAVHVELRQSKREAGLHLGWRRGYYSPLQ